MAAGGRDSSMPRLEGKFEGVVVSDRFAADCVDDKDWGGSSNALGHSVDVLHRRMRRRLRFILPFHQFFTALSLRAWRLLAISAQRFPISPTRRSIWSPSSVLIGSWLSEGFKFWWYRSRHCLGQRLPMSWAIRTQFTLPWVLTRWTR